MSEGNSKIVENDDGESEKKNDCNKVFTNNVKDDYLSDNSQELFSDEEETNQIKECTLQRSMDDCSFLNSFKTPVLHSDVEENVSNSPVIPKTPASLAPFIYKINEPWTSELETPEAKLATKLQTSSVSSDKSWKSIERTSKHQQTPILEKIRSENDASPILSNSKKKKPKRQIFKSNAYENLEITSSFENILKTEESKINNEVLKESESISSNVQEEVCNDSQVIKNSSPKCLDNETKVQSNDTSSATKSLIDQYRKVTSLLNEQENFDIPKVDIHESDMLKNVIQLEEASTDFSRPTEIISSTINEIGLVPFSQYFQNTNDKYFNETKDNSKINENAKETKVIKESYCQVQNKSSTTKSPQSKQVKIFNDKSEKKITVLEEDNDSFNFEFSQWLYNGDDFNETAKSDGKIGEIENENLEKKKENDQKLEKAEEKILFQEMDSFDFEQNFKDEITPEDLKKEFNLESSKLTGACGFSTAGGRSIKIDKDRLAKAEKMYQEIENNPKYVLKAKENQSSKIPSFSKENNFSGLEKQSNFDAPNSTSIGFSTAGGRSIKIDKDRLAKAEKLYQEIENNQKYEIQSSEIPSFNKKNNFSDLEKQSNFEAPNSTSIGFSTAGGRSIKIDKDRLAKAEKLYQEIESNSKYVLKAKENQSSEIPSSSKENNFSGLEKQSNFEAPNSTSIGFSTAGGRSIKIDKDRLAKAEKLYQEIENNQKYELETKEFQSSEIPSFSKKNNFSDLKIQSNFEAPNSTSIGFSTAGGRSIKIDKDRLAKAEKLYQEIESNSKYVLKAKENQSSEIPSSSKENNFSGLEKQSNFEAPNSTSIGFSTAGGKSIKIDKDRLAKAEKLYQEIENNQKYEFETKEIQSSEILSACKKNNISDVITNTSGFATASGRNIAISHERLSMAQKIYNEIEINATDKEAIGKENQCSSIKTPKSFLNTNIQNKNENSSEMKRKIVDGNTNNSKRFKPLHIGISRNSPMFNRNLSKNAKIENSEFKNASNDFKIDVQEELLKNEKLFSNIYESEIENTRKTHSLPVNSENKINIKMNQQRLSLPTTFRNKVFQPVYRNNLPNAILPDSSIPESPPFHGFSSQKFVSAIAKLNSTSLYGFTEAESLKSNLLHSKFIDLFEKINNLEKEENFLTISGISNEREEEMEEIPSSQLSIPIRKNSQIESKVPNVDFSTSDKKIEIDVNKTSDNLIKKAINLNLQNAKFPNRKSQWNNILKRQIDEVDDNTPLGRHDNSKKPKLDLFGRKLFSEDIDDEIESINQPGPSTIVNHDKEFHDYNSSILTDSLVSEEFFKPFTEETTNLELKNEKQEVKIEEKTTDFPDEAPKSPVLGKSKLKKRRKLRTSGLGNSKMEKFDSILSDCSPSLQTFNSDSLNFEVLEKRISSAVELDKIISRKRKEKPRPIRGSFLINREENKNSRISLHKLANGSVPTLRSEQELKEREIDPEVLNVTASNAEIYKFKIDIDEFARRNIVSLKCGDGATLVLNKSGSAGVEEFETAFEASPGVDPSLLPRGWLRNHYRWIVWKLASMDRIKLGSTDVPKMLTPDRVMKDLKYRYDREIDRSQRPVIRKILEKDEVPSKRMVLCISTITESVENEKEEKDPRILLRTPRWKIEVTDGWYSIPVSFDTAMMKNIIDGKIQEGTKIVTYGAELLNCDQGCYPLEKLESVCLKIHTNSTRRARWDLKLGLQKISGPITSSLKAIDPNGGFIGQINVIVSRLYPIMYREKTTEGQSIYRNEKQEEKAAMDYNHQREKKAETLYAKAEKKLQGGKHDYSEDHNTGSLINFDSLNNLSESELNKFLFNRQAKMEKLKREIDEEVKASYPPRNVVPVRKIRILDGEVCAILTIWSTSDDVSIFKEGNCYSIFNVNAYGKRDGELHLTASRQAIFKPTSNLNRIYPCRQFTSLPEISVLGFEPPYRELDTVGVVSWIGNTPHGMKNFDAICISYPNEDSSSTYLLIMFWQGISSYGLSNILTIGSMIGCSNLEIRKTRSASNISLCYCSERTVFTKNPRQAHLLSAFETLNKQIMDTKVYAKTCGEEIINLLQKKPTSRISGQGIMDSAERHLANSPHFMVAKTPIDVDTPIKSSAIQKRIERLSRYGQPPEVSPIVLNNSRSVRSSFRPVIMTPNSTKLTNTRSDTT